MGKAFLWWWHQIILVVHQIIVARTCDSIGVATVREKVGEKQFFHGHVKVREFSIFTKCQGKKSGNFIFVYLFTAGNTLCIFY